ncbi:MAG: pyridine nucleotide-disulfide oxidoreductase, partial [Gammaproteobacteria bacterium]
MTAAQHLTDRAEAVLTLGFPGFEYADLFVPKRLQDLLAVFDDYVRPRDPDLLVEFERYRAECGQGMSPEAISDLLVRMAPFVGAFVARLFGIGGQRERHIDTIRREMDTVFAFRREVVMKCDARFTPDDLAGWDLRALEVRIAALLRCATAPDEEGALAEMGIKLHVLCLASQSEGAWEDQAEALRQQLNYTCAGDPNAVALAPVLAAGTARELVSGLMELIQRFCYAARHHPGLRARVAGWVSFKEPKKTDFQHLVHSEPDIREGHKVLIAPPARRRRRDGFALTDRRMNERQVLYEVDHCIYCHDRDT